MAQPSISTPAPVSVSPTATTPTATSTAVATAPSAVTASTNQKTPETRVFQPFEWKESVVILNNGVAMPTVGLGCFQMNKSDARTAVTTALKAGYRAIDTASIYRSFAPLSLLPIFDCFFQFFFFCFLV